MAGSHSEPARKLVHILVGGFALFLRTLTWWQAALCAAAALLLNAFVLPRLLPALARPGAAGRPDTGIVLYPAAVLALILIWPSHLEVAAVAWAVLAWGDGFATLVGAHVPSAPLPWNPRKSRLGLAAFLVFGAAASGAVAAWMAAGTPPLPRWWIVAAPLAATLVAGFVETLPIRLNDNISVPAAAALTAAAVGWIDAGVWQAAWPGVVHRLPVAVGLNAAAAAAGWAGGTVTIAGAVTGAAIGVAVYAGLGWPGWLMLFAAFLAAAIATRLGRARKVRAGIAEARGGRRGPGNAIANTGLAAALAVLAIGVVDRPLVLVAFVASLATSASDTIASEIGKAWGKTTWLITRWTRVSPGTSGAISIEGTIAGVAGAALLAGIGVSLGLITWPAAGMVTIAATLAALVESVLGATVEARGILDNDALNFVNALLGAGLAAAIIAAGRTALAGVS